jgi:serine phosphatase RsbU (regulator of sigma subunit)
VSIRLNKIFWENHLDEEEKLKRLILIRLLLITSFLGIGWGLFYVFYLKLTISGLCPIIYALLSFINLFQFFLFKKYNTFRITQLLLILFLPFCTHISLGSYTNASGVVLACILCPIGALMFHTRKTARLFFYGFVAIVIIAGFFDVYEVHTEVKLKNTFVVLFFVFDFVMICSIVFVLVEYYVVKEKELKNLLIQKNKSITDSITYAKKIQEAILPSDKQITLLLQDSFILYKPKDIVSGDFYWLTQLNNKILFAAVDCTGHGVPGALMSIVGQNLINKAINELGLTKPDLILNSLNKGISHTLNQNNSITEIKDGMDIALCCWDIKEMTLEFAGAYNPLWIVRNGEIIVVEGDKFPIGSFVDDHPQIFKNNEIPLQKGDIIYIFTDGYADQFGGPNGKKFKQKQVKKILLEIQHLPLLQQRELLDKHIEDWKGGKEEQLDDILFMGIKI